MKKTKDFSEALEAAFAVEPRVLPDARRLRRRWAPTEAGAPGSWTVRWIEPALEALRAWTGLEFLRRLPNGGWYLDVRRLAARVGGSAILRNSLDVFLDKHPTSVRPRSSLDLDAPALADLPEHVRHWIEDGRERLRSAGVDEIVAVVQALEVVARARKAGLSVNASELGARTDADSKFFRPGAPGRRLLADALSFLNAPQGEVPAARESLLAASGVVDSPTSFAVLAAGPLALGDLDYPARLAERGESVVLTLQNIVSPRFTAPVEGLLTIENEASFLAALREGFHQRWLLVATGGFPNRAVTALLTALRPAAPSWRHWGDTDLAGVRIARTLAEALGGPPEFFRCGPDDVRRHRARLRPLKAVQSRGIAADLRERPSAPGADVLRTVLAEGGWLEQEAWGA